VNSFTRALKVLKRPVSSNNEIRTNLVLLHFKLPELDIFCGFQGVGTPADMLGVHICLCKSARKEAWVPDMSNVSLKSLRHLSRVHVPTYA
jgi:hypothetical protein